MTVEQPPKRAGDASRLASIAWFASSTVFRQFVNAGAILLRPALLTPEQFGLFSIIRLLPLYAHYLHLGARHGMRYTTPLHEARGEQEQVRRLDATVFTGALVLTAIAAAVLVGLALWSDWSAEVRIALAICAATILLGCLYDHSIASLKSHRMFRKVGINNYMNAIVYAVTGVALITTLGFYGAMLAEMVVIAVMLGVMAFRGIVHWRWGFDAAVFKAAVCLGAPSLLFDATLMIMRTTDRFVIASTLDYQQLGYYGLGAMVMGYVMHIPGATREVMEADLFYNRDHLSPQQAFRHYVVEPVATVGFSMLFVIGPMVLVLPVVVRTLLPAYVEGVHAAQILMLGGYFVAIAFPIRGILAAYGWQFWGALILLGACVLHTGLSYALIRLGLGIVGVALSAGVSFFLAAMALILFVIFKLPVRPHGWGAFILRALLPFPVLLGALYGATALGEWLHWSPLATAGAQLLVFGQALAIGTVLGASIGVIPIPPLRQVFDRWGRRAST